MRISKSMSIGEIREAFRVCGYPLGRGWEIVLYMLFNQHNAEEADLVGYGHNLEIHFITKEEK